jgi:hypothetical protein
MSRNTNLNRYLTSNSEVSNLNDLNPRNTHNFNLTTYKEMARFNYADQAKNRSIKNSERNTDFQVHPNLRNRNKLTSNTSNNSNNKIQDPKSLNLSNTKVVVFSEIREQYSQYRKNNKSKIPVRNGRKIFNPLQLSHSSYKNDSVDFNGENNFEEKNKTHTKSFSALEGNLRKSNLTLASHEEINLDDNVQEKIMNDEFLNSPEKGVSQNFDVNPAPESNCGADENNFETDKFEVIRIEPPTKKVIPPKNKINMAFCWNLCLENDRSKSQPNVSSKLNEEGKCSNCLIV